MGIYWNVRRTLEGYIIINHTIEDNGTFTDYGAFQKFFEKDESNQEFERSVTVIDEPVQSSSTTTLYENYHYMWGDMPNVGPIESLDNPQQFETNPIFPTASAYDQCDFCPSNTVCNGGICVPIGSGSDPCAGVLCPPGQSCSGGICSGPNQ